MRNSLRLLLIVTAQTLLLCSCARMSPFDQSGNKPAEGELAGSHYESTAVQSLEKSGLLISYSLQVIPDNECKLLRLTLVIRNQQKRAMTVSPRVVLADASGKTIKAYSKPEFIQLLSRQGKVASKIAGNPELQGGREEKRVAELRSQLGNINWLNPRYKIPANGIVIGDLVYRCTDFKAPLTLTVNSNKLEFVFQPGAGKR
jgi:hypothetical protein